LLRGKEVGGDSFSELFHWSREIIAYELFILLGCHFPIHTFSEKKLLLGIFLVYACQYFQVIASQTLLRYIRLKENQAS
jgi:hypothetical protein